MFWMVSNVRPSNQQDTLQAFLYKTLTIIWKELNNICVDNRLCEDVISKLSRLLNCRQIHSESLCSESNFLTVMDKRTHSFYFRSIIIDQNSDERVIILKKNSQRQRLTLSSYRLIVKTFYLRYSYIPNKIHVPINTSYVYLGERRFFIEAVTHSVQI